MQVQCPPIKLFYARRSHLHNEHGRKAPELKLLHLAPHLHICIGLSDRHGSRQRGVSKKRCRIMDEAPLRSCHKSALRAFRHHDGAHDRNATATSAEARLVKELLSRKLGQAL